MKLFPIIRAIQATNPELVVIYSYPNSSVGMVHPSELLKSLPEYRHVGLILRVAHATPSIQVRAVGDVVILDLHHPRSSPGWDAA